MKARPRPRCADDQPLRSTTHLTVADDEGTVVSYTFTIESTGGNGIVVPGWGFLLNNELTDFNFTPTQGAAPDPNLPAGGKRPRSSMAPTIVQRDGEPVLATGSPGRRDDHHDGAADPARAVGLRQVAPGGHRRAARVAAQHRDDAGRAGLHRLAGGAGARHRVRARLRHARADPADQRRDRRGDRHRLAGGRRPPGGRRARAPRRRRGRGGRPAARRRPSRPGPAARRGRRPRRRPRRPGPAP